MLKCFYTNCDTLTNKMDELLFYINTNNPDILVLTEVAPITTHICYRNLN